MDGGRELVTTSGDGKLRLWDLATGRLVGSPLPGSTTGGWAPPSRTVRTQSQSSPTAPASSGTSSRAPGRPTHAASRTATSRARSGTTSYRSAGSAPSVRNCRRGCPHHTRAEPATVKRASSPEGATFRTSGARTRNANTGRCKSVTAVESVARMSLRGLEPDRRSPALAKRVGPSRPRGRFAASWPVFQEVETSEAQTRRSLPAHCQEAGRPPQGSAQVSVSVAQRGEPYSQDPDRTDDTDLIAARGTRPCNGRSHVLPQHRRVPPFRRPPGGRERPRLRQPEMPAGGPEAARCH